MRERDDFPSDCMALGLNLSGDGGCWKHPPPPDRRRPTEEVKPMALRSNARACADRQAVRSVNIAGASA